jgi:hypothetical protein
MGGEVTTTSTTVPTIPGYQSYEDVLADIASHEGAVRRADTLVARAMTEQETFEAHLQRNALRCSLRRLQAQRDAYHARMGGQS